MTSYTKLETPVGGVMLTANDQELTGLYFVDCDHVPAEQKTWTLDAGHPVLKKAARELKEYFDGKRTQFSFPPSARGTDFQKRVWNEIAKIPFGETIAYSDLARRAGKPKAIRAAGTATGRNPIGIIIPCHRVLGKHGAIGGYAGGLEIKRRLLKHENIKI